MESYMAQNNQTLQSADLRWLGGQQINHKIYLEFKKKKKFVWLYN